MSNKKSYFDRLRGRVAKQQGKIVSDTLDALFDNSPHLGDPESPWATGEYEINHKVSINGENPGPHFPPLTVANNARKIIERQSSLDTDADAKVNFKPEFIEIVTSMSNTGKAFITKEKLMSVPFIQCGDRATISNDTEHALSVEYGEEVDAGWGKPGYRTYAKSKKQIKAKYKNVLK